MSSVPGRIPAVDVIRHVAEQYGLTVQDIRTVERSRRYAFPRFAAIHCLLQLCPHLSLPMIASALNRKDHTTVINGRDRASELMHTDAKFADVVDRTMAAFAPRVADRLAGRLLHTVKNSKEAQAVYREANAAGVGDDVARKVRMGSVFA